MPSDSETPGGAHSSSETNPPNQQNQASTNVPRSGLPPFPPFDPLSDRASLGLRWRKWSRRFENLLLSLRELDPTIRRGRCSRMSAKPRMISSTRYPTREPTTTLLLPA